MQDWTDVAGKLYTWEDHRRKMQNSVASKFVEVNYRLRAAVLISAQRVPHGEVASSDVESPFQASVRAIIGRLEHVLATEFGVIRMQITPGAAPEQANMTWNKDVVEEVAISPTGR